MTAISDIIPAEIETRTETARCLTCGQPFDAESAHISLLGRRISVTICDACAARESGARNATAIAQRSLTPEEKRQRRWLALVPPRYAAFHREQLPPAILPHVERVLAWQPQSQSQSRGIGLLGPSRTGKSPLLFGLALRLHHAGHDVFPTSGIEFQRMVHRSVVDREAWSRYLDRCENAAVLLLDDADKLNFTPGVEAEYYGLLETRRNWQRPILCTLNLTGRQLKELAADRNEARPDRMPAIVERLRDLCEFISVNTSSDP